MMRRFKHLLGAQHARARPGFFTYREVSIVGEPRDPFKLTDAGTCHSSMF